MDQRQHRARHGPREPPQPESGASGLEGHLRSLILGNSNPGQSAIPGGSEAAGPPPPNGSTLPQPAQNMNPVQTRADPETARGPSVNQSTRGSRSKRPNQATRRQMSAQLTVPIDPRPQPLGNGRGHHYSGSRSSHGRQNANSPGGTQPPSHHFHSQTFGRGHRIDHHPQAHAPPQISPTSPQQPAYHYPSPSLDGPGVPLRQQHGGFQSQYHRPSHSASFQQPRRLYQPAADAILAQTRYLETLCAAIAPEAEIQREEIVEKEAFRMRIEAICRDVVSRLECLQPGGQEFPAASVELKCYGSLASGFATQASDMDLGLLSPFSAVAPESPGSPLPRLIEKAFLDAGLGARLLTKTRVPILKVCESPPDDLRRALLEQRDMWEKGIENDGQVIQDHDDEIDATREIPNGSQQDPAHGPAVEGASDDKASYHGAAAASGVPGEQHLAFRQLERAPLSSYHAVAKRHLRKYGGQDLTSSNWKRMTPGEYDVLNTACESFVAGLFDAELRRRLESYRAGCTGSQPRSLYETYLLAEGEWMVMLWERRVLREHLRENEDMSQSVVDSWKQTLLLHASGSLDLSHRLRELQSGVDHLRSVPSIAILAMEQDQQETPQQYAARFLACTKELRPYDYDKQSVQEREQIVRLYINGVNKSSVRDCLFQWLENTTSVPQLIDVGLRHRCLQAVADFENSLAKKLYADDEAAAIRAYIQFVKDAVTDPATADRSGPLCPRSDDAGSLIRAIAFLPKAERDRYRDRLEFPKSGAGVQCDISFTAQLALQNTRLLRCYSSCDGRVRPMVLFVKHWAKVRGINSSYRGTLSSYGYVLMVLHYLVNIADPFVCPNLQLLAKPPPPDLSPLEFEDTVRCRGRNVQFWRDEDEIIQLAQRDQLNRNSDPVALLLRGFFEYFAHSNVMTIGRSRGFDWGREVLSLRTPGGLRQKQEKGWTGARTVVQVQQSPTGDQHVLSPGADAGGQPDATTPRAVEFKETRNRYLLAIEDPFELEHNVARTVNHQGVVAIRDEFRRAWRILQNAGSGLPHHDLLEDAAKPRSRVDEDMKALMMELHGSDWALTG